MPSQTVNCPYCNSAVLVADNPHGNLICPRCEESFPLPSTENFAGRSDFQTDQSAQEASVPAGPNPNKPSFSNKRIAALVLALMLFMGLIGLAYAWRTVLVRRTVDLKSPKTQSLEIPVLVKVALGVYVGAIILAVIYGWNRGERTRKSGQAEPWTKQYGIPLLGLAVLGIVVVAIVLIQTRPSRQPSANQLSDPASVPAVLPSQLAGLSYLPGDVNFLAAVHVAECSRTPAGRQFLERFHLRGDTWGLSTLQKWTSVKVRDIDHAIIGVSLKTLIPRVTLIVRTIQPYDLPGVVDELKARETKTDEKTVYRFELADMGREAYLWPADEKTLALSWPDEAVKSLPSSAFGGMGQLSLPLQSFITQQIDPSAREQPAQVWAACHVENWRDSPAQLLVLLKIITADEWETLSSIKTLGCWGQLQEGAKLHLAFQSVNEQAAGKLREALLKGGKKLPFIKADGLAKPIIQELGENLEVNQQGDWLKLESKVSAETIGKTLGKSRQ
jgi:hypothetical protein